ncbi:major latex allergen Hev b 5-like isoform X1 [Nicotiana tomentosiformis]|uniref:major latex allergen Hev b 5-like isoform X1 n=1 Tax=Nicotiana tomentosiformis TaxID=4098 RepID=UPI00051B4449|nr:putative surface protein SACOL0050 isoform X1 [Nicotiana tomentosiformis]
MGACATKPKELKGEAPEDVPENVTAAKDVTVVAEEVKKEVEVGADDDPEKRRSLSNLFKQNEEVKGLEQVKEEASEITQASEPSEAKPNEVEKVVDAPVTTETERALEVVSTIEAPKAETSEEKKIEEVKSETKTPVEKKVEEVTVAAETPAEKKIEEAPAATEAPKSEAPVEKKAEEKSVATEAPKSEAPVETKAEEKPVATEAPKSEAPVVTKAEEKPAAEAEKTVIEEKKSDKS